MPQTLLALMLPLFQPHPSTADSTAREAASYLVAPDPWGKAFYAELTACQLVAIPSPLDP